MVELLQLAALDESRFYLIRRNSLFVPPRTREEHILDVFPQFPMLCQIDLNGHLAALLTVTYWIRVMAWFPLRDGIGGSDIWSWRCRFLQRSNDFVIAHRRHPPALHLNLYR